MSYTPHSIINQELVKPSFTTSMCQYELPFTSVFLTIIPIAK